MPSQDPENITKQQRRARIFVASSEKNIELAFGVQQNLENNRAHAAHVTVWNQEVFRPSRYALDQIVDALDESDFGIFIFEADDTTQIGGGEFSSVRDNVIFELGLFIGRLGKNRCFIVTPRGRKDLRIPSDLAGLTFLTFDAAQLNKTAALGSACYQIGKAVSQLGPLNMAPRLSATEIMIRDIWDRVTGPAPRDLKKLSIEALPEQRISAEADEGPARAGPKSKKRKSRVGKKSK